MGGQQITGTVQAKTITYQPSNTSSLSSTPISPYRQAAWPIAEIVMGLVILCAGLGAFRLLQISLTEKWVITDCPHIHTNTTYLGYPAVENMVYGYEVVAELTHAIERVPTCANLYWSLGDVQAWLGERNKALESYRHYLRLAGDQADSSVMRNIQRLEDDLIENPLVQQAAP